MMLRYSKILKGFVILLFIFELLAPAIVQTTAAFQNSFSKATFQQEAKTQPYDLLSNLLFEEVSSEEREGKDNFLINLCCIELFSELKKFTAAQIIWPLSKGHYDTHPPLFTLHRALLI